MQLQSATPAESLTDRSPEPRRRPPPNLGGAPGPNPLILHTICGCDLADQQLADGIARAVMDVFPVRDRQPLSSRSVGAAAHVLIEGWAFRSHILPDGTRQITDIIVPGDFCSAASSAEPTCSIEACGPARVAVLRTGMLPDRVRTIVERAQRAQQVDVVRRLRARLVSLGRRDARERLAYLVAETYSRLASVDLARNGAFTWPFTQEHLADSLGLTPVHTNRVLARLRSEDLLVIRNRRVMILNQAALRRAGGYEDPDHGRDGCDDDLL